MSAWPEAVYIIKKLNNSLDLALDLSTRVLPSINEVNDRINELEGSVNEDITDIQAAQITIKQDLETAQATLESLQENIQGLSADLQEIQQAKAQLDDFSEDLDKAEKHIVFIDTNAASLPAVSPASTDLYGEGKVSQYSVFLIKS